MELVDTLEALATLNKYGVAFLTGFGLTWATCAVLWRKASERTAALITLMQGVIGLPIALGISYAIGALGVDRPVDPAIDQLSALIGASQMLGFPLAIFLFATRRYLLVPYVLSSVVAMHFVLYSWLYQTPFYIVMAVVIVVGGLVMMSLADRRSDVSAGTASLVCAWTGGSLLATAIVLLVI